MNMGTAQKRASISTLTGFAQAQCSLCGRVFSTAANFDRHLVRHKHDGQTVRVTCRNPAIVGLVQNHVGIWTRTPDQKSISLLRRSEISPQNPKEVSRYGSVNFRAL